MVFPLKRPNLHADAEVVALLVFAQQLIVARIEEIGMRIEGAWRARNGALINGLIGVDLVGEVLLHQVRRRW